MNFDTFLKTMTVGTFGSFGLIEVFFSLIVPAILCIGIVFTYKKAQMHASFSPSFLLMLYMFASLSGGVTLFIGENVARAFGLVGAMSIIRFRNALKEPIDAVFVLWALTIGMVCGAGYYFAALFITVVVSAITLSVKAFGLANFPDLKTVVKIVTQDSANDSVLNEVEEKLKGITREYKMLHEMTSPESKTRTHVYTLVPKKHVKIKQIETEIGSIKGARVYGSIYRPAATVIE